MASKRKSRLLEIEVLEDRLAPAVYTVNTVADPNPGVGAWNGYNRAGCSLRWAITDMNNQAQANNTINITNMGGQGGQISAFWAREVFFDPPEAIALPALSASDGVARPTSPERKRRDCAIPSLALPHLKTNIGINRMLICLSCRVFFFAN